MAGAVSLFLDFFRLIFLLLGAELITPLLLYDRERIVDTCEEAVSPLRVALEDLMRLVDCSSLGREEETAPWVFRFELFAVVLR